MRNNYHFVHLWTSVKIGTIQRRLAWPLRKDDTHKSRTYHFFCWLVARFFSPAMRWVPSGCPLVCKNLQHPRTEPQRTIACYSNTVSAYQTNQTNQQEKKQKKKNKKGVDSTPHCSRVVPHPSTEQAQTALTSVFGWEPVHYGWYGRIRYGLATPLLLYWHVFLPIAAHAWTCLAHTAWWPAGHLRVFLTSCTCSLTVLHGHEWWLRF